MLRTWYLEMLEPAQLRGKALPAALSVVEVQRPQFAFNRFLYQLVGGPWAWTDRLSWSDAQWRELVESDSHRTFVAYRQGAIAGYYELQRPDACNVEILYFGLAADCIGEGFGGPLLTHALDSAWAWAGTERVWVHTCSLDHAGALANYQARGMRIYREEDA